MRSERTIPALQKRRDAAAHALGHDDVDGEWKAVAGIAADTLLVSSEGWVARSKCAAHNIRVGEGSGVQQARLLHPANVTEQVSGNHDIAKVQAAYDKSGTITSEIKLI